MTGWSSRRAVSIFKGSIPEFTLAQCYSCGKSIDPQTAIGFRDECASCGADLHVCLNCEFYDPNAADECREPSAERVQEKDRSNFCEYFQPSDRKGRSGESVEEARKRFQSIFKKK